jgi:hypothetical protein
MTERELVLGVVLVFKTPPLSNPPGKASWNPVFVAAPAPRAMDPVWLVDTTAPAPRATVFDSAAAAEVPMATAPVVEEGVALNEPTATQFCPWLILAAA